MIDEEEYLISYANLKSNLFTYQNDFLDNQNLHKFYKNQFMGVPICLPKGIKFFDYSNANYFKIDQSKFSKYIFSTNKINYIGNKKFFRYGSQFATNVLLKKKYYKKFKFYLANIEKTKKIILNLKKKKERICSMQIRNAPHFGHEAVFKHILNRFDLLILNPIFGIKKKKDFNDKVISKALSFMEKKYKKIKFLPIWSSFHYAGPREAMHHLSMRENLGFSFFYIGRDHAGAQNLYNANAATKSALRFQKKFKIKAFTSGGGYFCSQCNDYIVKGICNHNKLINISGTDFRSCLKKKSIYSHADKDLQKTIKSIT